MNRMISRAKVLTLILLCLLLSGCRKDQTVSEGGGSDFISGEKAQVGTEDNMAEEKSRVQEGQSTETEEKATEGNEQTVKTEQEKVQGQAAATENEKNRGETETASERVEVKTEAEQTEAEQSGPLELNFENMYDSSSSSRGLRFSDLFLSGDGKTVQLSGYMAPPLKPVFHFFVLSKNPMSICPFCSSDADWPEDIVVVYVEDGAKSVANDTRLTVTGRLELGSYTDEETGFVSQARIYAEKIEYNR